MMNLFQIEYFCDLTNPEETMDISYINTINADQARELYMSCLSSCGKVEDPTGLLFYQKFDDLAKQESPMMVLYADDVHEHLCRQFMIVCANYLHEAEEIGDIESWNYILDLRAMLEEEEELFLTEPDDEPESEETDGMEDEN